MYPPSTQNNSRQIMREKFRRILRMPLKGVAAWILTTKFGLDVDWMPEDSGETREPRKDLSEEE